MTTVDANGVALGVERFGAAAPPLVLLVGGTTMLSWPDALCEALARPGRHVVRYELRDCREVDHCRRRSSEPGTAMNDDARMSARPIGGMCGRYAPTAADADVA